MTRLASWCKTGMVLLTGSVVFSANVRSQTTNAVTTLEFSQPTFAVGENTGGAVITIRRNGPTNSAVSVKVTAVPLTASPSEFSAPPAPVEISAGKTSQSFSIGIVDDYVEDGNKTVRLTLSDPTGGAALGAISTAELIITDNESRQAVWVTFGLDRLPLMRQTIFGIPLWQFTSSLIYIFLAFYVSKLVDYWMRCRFKRWAARTNFRFGDILGDLLRGPIKVIAFVILLHVGLRIFSWPQWFADFLSKALKIILAVSLTYMALRFIDGVTGYWRRRAIDDQDRSFNEQLLPIVRNSLKVFAIVVAVLLTLQNLGLNITSLITSLGIGGLALALAAQDTLANFFGAIVILVDKPFRIGDQVKLDTVEGTVEIIGFRSTRVRTADGHLVAIPNKTIGNSILTNISRRPHIRSVTNLALPLDTPPDKLKRAVAIVEDIFGKHPETKDVMIAFNKFADTWINLQIVHVWNGTDAKKHAAVLQDLNLQVKDRFEKEGIKFKSG